MERKVISIEISSHTTSLVHNCVKIIFRNNIQNVNMSQKLFSVCILLWLEDESRMCSKAPSLCNLPSESDCVSG